MATRWVPTHLLDFGEPEFAPLVVMLVDPGDGLAYLYERDDWETEVPRAKWRLRAGVVESANGGPLHRANLRLIVVNGH